MKRRTKVVLGVIPVLGIGVTATFSAVGGDGDAETRTVEVKRGEVVDKALAVGRIEPLVEISVKSQLAGVVRRQFAEVGAHVRRGDPLLEIQPNPTPLELVEARRQVELEQIGLANLAKRRERLHSLRESEYVSAEEYEAADREYEQAKLQVQMAKERLALLQEGKVRLGTDRVETVIHSPIDGFVLEKMVEIGDPVVPLTTFQEGTVLMTMAEMDELIFRGTVDEIDVGRLREGMGATLKIGALPDAEVSGSLTKISLKGREEENATIFPVEISVEPGRATVLRAGYSANADIIIERREDVLVVPERLLRFSGDSATVTVQLSGERTEERAIRTGLSDGILVEVLEGLEEGERVVEPPPREIG
ncbi:MAG: efflux RND transporter periplasmic adaptor subunit [Gemmatimonadota bacterium]